MKVELTKCMAKKIQNNGDKERRKVEKVLKRNICHMWHDADTDSQDIYYGRLLNIKKKNSAICIVSYWKPNENEADDSVEYDMTKYQLSANINGYMVIS